MDDFYGSADKAMKIKMPTNAGDLLETLKGAYLDAFTRNNKVLSSIHRDIRLTVFGSATTLDYCSFLDAKCEGVVSTPQSTEMKSTSKISSNPIVVKNLQGAAWDSTSWQVVMSFRGPYGIGGNGIGVTEVIGHYTPTTPINDVIAGMKKKDVETVRILSGEVAKGFKLDPETPLTTILACRVQGHDGPK